MNIPGPCSECGSALDGEQRYCINCGNRVAPPLALPYVPATPAEAAVVGAPAAASLSWLPMPLQAMTTFAALALGFGVVVGTALSPSLQNLLAAPQQVEQAPPPAEPAPAPAPSGGGGGGGGGPAVVGTTGSTVTTTPASDDGGGNDGGGKKKPKKKEKPDFVSGTVVHTNPVARSYTITSGGGLSSIHAVALPAVGTNVKVPIILLQNRTYAEDGKRQLTGAATQATFSGVVTDNRNDTTPSGPPDTYTVSARGSSILVHSPPDPTGLTEPPAIGKLVTTTVDIRDAAPTPLPSDPSPPPTCAPPSIPLPDPALAFPKELHQVAAGSLIVDPVSNVAATEIETVIQSLCPGTPGQFLLSSDDVREGKTDVELANSGIDMTRLSVGMPVIASVTIVDDVPPAKRLGSVTGVASDLGEDAANDPSGGQGDLARVARKMDGRIARALRRAERIRAKRRQTHSGRE